VIDVAYQGAKIATLKPEKRQYVTGMPMTEAAIDPSLFRDLYIALGESLGEGAWSLRLHDFIFCLLKYLLINQIILQVLF
jgi:cytochrome c-type biogenesis protein CcmF